MSTYTPIATQTLSSTAASVTFSSIPQGYTDLVVVARFASTSAGSSFAPGFTINNDSVSNGKLSFTTLYGTGTTSSTFRWTTSTATMKVVPIGTGDLTMNAGNMGIAHINNYSSTTTYKTIISRPGSASSDVYGYSVLWQDTSAINKIVFYPNDGTGTFVTGSTFSLYGIQVGNAAAKAQGGNIVTSDGTYVYHTFTSSGSFIPSQALTVDYLVVAGGGGGGFAYYPSSSQVGGAGGGAGGVRCTVGQTGGLGTLPSALSLTAKTYPVIVGAGGAGGIGSSQTYPTQGGFSTFATVSCTGGGTGGSTNGVVYGSGGNGGSGGGGAYSGSKGLKTAGEGFDGADGSTTSNATGGGGGGAGAAALNPTVVSGYGYSQGGNGISTNISGSSTYYGGGGGGSTYAINGDLQGGLGGGGAGGQGSGVGNAGTTGTVNTGGGGGAASGLFGGTTSLSGGNGASGIVIIRYLA